MIFSRIELEEGAAQPKWYYGLAYRSYYPTYICWYPLGIHFIVGWARKIYHFWLAKFVIPKCKPSRIDRMFIEMRMVHLKDLEQARYEKDIAWMKVIDDRFKMPEGFENFLNSKPE